MSRVCQRLRGQQPRHSPKIWSSLLDPEIFPKPFMSTTPVTLQRSVPISSAPKHTVNQEYNYPDGPPSSDIEKWAAKLDLQSFPSHDYARIDDILVYSLFDSKRSFKYYRALSPSSVFLQDSPSISNGIGMDICHIYLAHGRNSTDSPSTSSTVSKLLVDKYASLFSGPHDKEILNQYVLFDIPTH